MTYNLKDIMLYICERYPHKSELSNARLTKLIYLSDWKNVLNNKEQISNINWIFNHYGPFVNDVLDEAHNLFANGNRSILLSRLINLNKHRNSNQTILYLSPLVNNSSNLKCEKNTSISEHMINYNIKEPEYYEYRLDKTVHKYNRFTNKFHKYDNVDSYYAYIKKYATDKTFIFHQRPVKTEQFSKEFSIELPDIVITDEIEQLIDILTKYVHKDFYMIELIKKGIVYLHAKLPDQIKDYLEYQFKILPQLKYVVANSVILEGVNLPISSMFILNAWGLDKKKLTNLIGRVNRLNNIFDLETGSLKLLLPQIHFVNSDKYYKRNMKNKIELLRSKEFEDYIENPLLESYDLNKIKISYDTNKGETKESKKKEIQEQNIQIVKRELWLLEEPSTENERLKQALIRSGVSSFYEINDEFISELSARIITAKNQFEWADKNIITKLYEVFIKSFDNITDYTIKRLNEDAARNYYTTFIENSKKSLNEIVNTQMKYFKGIQKDNTKNTFYFGESYGEVSKDSKHYPNSNRNAYINLNEKTDQEIINLVIVKIKMEEDFVSFKLNNFFNLMLNEKLITSSEYNQIIYGTTDERKISLTRIGLPMNILTLLETNNQLDNISADKNNNFVINDKFKNYKNGLDDFVKFRIEKFL